MDVHASSSHDEEVVGPSDRSFGFVFTAVLAVVGLLPLWRGASPRVWALAVAGAIGLFAVVWPRALAPANRIWLRLGLLLHRIVNPVVMGAVFYLVITPFGFVMRRRHTGLHTRLRRDEGVPTYWIPREGVGSSMNQQF
jgi:hypothetical protein